MTEKKLSDYASDKCKERVEMVDRGDKEYCLDPKLKRGVALCTGFAMVKAGDATDLSDGIKKGWAKVKELCK